MSKRKAIPHDTMMKVYRRDRFTCQHCGKVGEFIYRYGIPRVIENLDGIKFDKPYYNGDGIIVFEIDHIKPVYLGGTNDIKNLQLLCHRCNRKKGLNYNGK